MGCVYSADRKDDMSKSKVQPFDFELRWNFGGERDRSRGGGNGRGPKHVNNLRGGSIKEVSPRGDVISGFT